MSVSNNLARITPSRKTGLENFANGKVPLDFDLLSFWQWSCSDILSNATRGVLAEYIVAKALGISVDVRMEWDAYDLQTTSGTKIEVKSSAYLQSWGQRKLSTITFGVPKRRAWDATTNRLGAESHRQADIYIFALLAHTDKQTVNPIDVSQWEFFVLPTVVLNERKRSQHSIGLKSLKLLTKSVAYADLGNAVENATESGSETRDAGL